MEAPFGTDVMDVDLSKIIRRIDKFTAAIMSLYLERCVTNFDVYAERRSTSVDHKPLKSRGETMTVSQMEGARAYAAPTPALPSPRLLLLLSP